MAIEDLTTYTETDVNGVLTVTSTRITGVNVDRDIEASVVKDFGAGYFEYVRLNFECYIDSLTATSALGPIAITQGLETGAGGVGAQDIVVYARDTSGSATIQIVRGSVVSDTSAALSFDTTYYCSLVKQKGLLGAELWIYSDSGRTTLVEKIRAGGFNADTTWRYFYAFLAQNDSSSGYDWDGWVQNFEFVSEPGNEDLTGYTEEDANAKLTVGQYMAIGADVDRDEDVWLVSDKTLRMNEINMDFEIGLLSTSDTSGAACVSLTVSNVGDLPGNGSSDIAVQIWEASGPLYYISLLRGNSVASDVSLAIVAGALYFCTLTRSANSDTATLKIYTDPNRADLHDTLSVSGYGTGTKYRYLYGFQNSNIASGAKNFDGVIGNLHLRTPLPTVLDSSATFLALTVTSYDSRIKLRAYPRDTRLTTRLKDNR